MSDISPLDEASPYAGFHVAVQIESKDLEDFSHSWPRSWPEGVHAITGVRKEKNRDPKSPRNREIHAVVFEAKTWKAPRAKKWLGDNKFSSDGFEEGEGEPPAVDYGGIGYDPDGSAFWSSYAWWMSEAGKSDAGPRAEMVSSMALYRTEITNLVRNVRTGLVRAEAAAERGRSVLSRSYENAYRQGGRSVGSPRYEDFDREYVEAMVDLEHAYLASFLRDVEAGTGSMAYGVRAAAYTRGYEAMYHFGEMMGLPWESDVYWILGSKDHCVDCVSLEASSPYSQATLSTVPGAGGTTCLFRCDCRLEYVIRPALRADLETDEGIETAARAAAGEIPEGLRSPSAREIESIRGLWGRVERHRIASRYARTEIRGVHERASAAAAEALANFVDSRHLRWTAGMAEAIFNPPPGGGEGGGYARGGRRGVKSKGKVVDGAGVTVFDPSVAAASVGDLGSPGDGGGNPRSA